MPDYHVKYETAIIDGTDCLILSLPDLQQYSDPLCEVELPGISPASWPLFCYILPSVRVLARAMLMGKHILEIGADLALVSLFIHRRVGGHDHQRLHPLNQTFLNESLLLNKLGPLKYQTGNWEGSNPELGQFDLIIGSDVHYERQQSSQLDAFIHRHIAPSVEVIIVARIVATVLVFVEKWSA